MKKQLILTLDLRLGLQNQLNLIKKYQNYIYTVNIDIPYLSSQNISFIKNTNYLECLINDKNELIRQSLEAANFIKTLNIKVGSIINNESLESCDLYEAVQFLNQLNPNELTLKKEYILMFKSFCNIDHFIMSRYNEETDLINEKFYGVTLRTTHYNKYKSWVSNIENRLLLNYCCPVNCPGCNYESLHFSYFDAEWDKDLEKYIANRIWTKYDIYKASNIWPDINFTYKIANRLWQKDQTNMIYLLDSYLDSLICSDFKNLQSKGAISYALINSPLQDEIRENNLLSDFDFDKFNLYKFNYWNLIESEVKNN